MSGLPDLSHKEPSAREHPNDPRYDSYQIEHQLTDGTL